MRTDDERQRQWPARLFFTFVTLFLTGGVLYFVLGTADPAFYWTPPVKTGSVDYAALDIGGSVVLEKDRPCRLDQVELVYRGLEQGRLRIEATLLKLDPDYAYVHRFAPDTIRTNDVRLGGYTFTIHRWSDARVRLERLP